MLPFANISGDKEERYTLQKGDLLFLYTDGVTEAINTENYLFSEDRLKDL